MITKGPTYDGERWFTSSTPLLNGVKRQYLLDLGKVSECDISKKDLDKFQKVSIVNAMLDLGEIVIPIESIEF